MTKRLIPTIIITILIMGSLGAVAVSEKHGETPPPAGLQKFTLSTMGGDIKGTASEEFEVLFRPKSFTFDKTVPWSEHRIHGLDNPETQFTTGDPMSLAIEMFFDTYEEGTDVREITKKLENLIYKDSKPYMSPKCIMNWGSGLQFNCVVQSVDTECAKFDGTAVRCVANVRFSEYTPTTEQHKRTKLH